MLFSELADLYLADKKDGRKAVRLNTLEGYTSAIRNHLLPAWGKEEVESIGFDDVQSWVDSYIPRSSKLITWYLPFESFTPIAQFAFEFEA